MLQDGRSAVRGSFRRFYVKNAVCTVLDYRGQMLRGRLEQFAGFSTALAQVVVQA